MAKVISTEAYPLQWPTGWPRTETGQHTEGKHQFRRPVSSKASPFWTFPDARDALVDEVRRLTGGGPMVISSNFRVARDGLPVEGGRRPYDQGVAIYFDLGGRQMVMACDRYIRAEENMRSLALAIEAMRQLDRHGGGHMLERAFTGFQALPPPRSTCWDVLGLKPGASEAEIDQSFRDKAKAAHPDLHGGSHERMAELARARDEAKGG